MHVKRLKVSGFKTLRSFEMELNEHMNIVVGDNESGKSTVIEALNVALFCQVAGRSVLYDFDPYYFNTGMVNDYYRDLRNGKNPETPRILIEAYLDDADTGELAKLKGSNNTRGENCPGLYVSVELHEDLADEFRSYVSDTRNAELMPIEYFEIAWRSFADNLVSIRSLPFHVTVIDTTLHRAYFTPNKYVARIINDCLEQEQRISLATAYRQLKHRFMQEPGIKDINDYLTEKKGDITPKALTVSLDMSARSTWDSSITAHLDNIPFDGVGKGEQCRVQMKLAIEAAYGSNLLLIEEPENHLSHSNMARLIQEVGSKSGTRQMLITTHSSFVLNKLGIDSVKLLSSHGIMTLEDLSPETSDYFRKPPGYDTLRLLLASRTILVEGPSDELIVQKAYLMRYGKLPLEDAVDVIAVRALAFKRFLEIGAKLGLDIRVVTDNDGDICALHKKYEGYLSGQYPTIEVCYDTDPECPTLEPQLLKANSLKALNRALGKDFPNREELLSYMLKNKTASALKLFSSAEPIDFPDYICHAIES